MPLPRRLPWWLKLVNPVFKTLIRHGFGGDRQQIALLAVPGRKTGQLHSTPVSLLRVEGRLYVVSLPWINWAKNARVSGWGMLTQGRHTQRIALHEVVGDERAQVARAFPVQVPHGVRLFELPPDPDAFEAAASGLAVFRLESTVAGGQFPGTDERG
jgi:hypothetical protein